MKKSYNPFKMLGAWIGLSVGLLYSIWKISANVGWDLGLLFRNDIVTNSLRRILLTKIILIPIMLFLLGWGIHSLIRAVRK